MLENFIDKIKLQLNKLEEIEVCEISDLNLITAQNLKSMFREDYNIIGPATDEENSKLFVPRYRLAFMLYSKKGELQNA